jgi:hypothetical protein
MRYFCMGGNSTLESGIAIFAREVHDGIAEPERNRLLMEDTMPVSSEESNVRAGACAVCDNALECGAAGRH